MQKQKINIIKVPKEPSTEGSKRINNFPRMPRMYLELIENKDKIKANLVNKEYDPDEASTVVTEINHEFPIEYNQPITNYLPKIQESSVFVSQNQDNHSVSSNSSSQIIQEDDDLNEEDENSNEGHSNQEEENSNEEHSIEENLNEDIESHIYPSSIRSSNESNKDDLIEESDARQLMEESSIVKSQSIAFNEKSEMMQSSSPQYMNPSNVMNVNQQTTKDKLKEILQNPPKLSELEKKGFVKTQKVIPNLDANETIEEEDELKRELLYKFDLLKRSYKNVEIPDFTIHSDYKHMNKAYESTLRRVSLDTNVENYKNYMIAGFMLIEYILSAWFKFDMSGFTQQQIINMNQYERLLIELGEKSYVPTNKQWPVELRLLGMILLNAVIFIIARIIIKKTGTNLFGLINTAQTNTSTAETTKKRKMKGPSLDLDSIHTLS